MPGKHVRALATILGADRSGGPNGAVAEELKAANAPRDLMLVARTATVGEAVHLGQWEIRVEDPSATVDYLEDNDLADEIDEVHAVVFARNATGRALIAAFDEGDDETSIYLVEPAHAECQMLAPLERWLEGVAAGDDLAGRVLLDSSDGVRRLRDLAAALPDEP
jgi:hypothetical protein